MDGSPCLIVELEYRIDGALSAKLTHRELTDDYGPVTVLLSWHDPSIVEAVVHKLCRQFPVMRLFYKAWPIRRIMARKLEMKRVADIRKFLKLSPPSESSPYELQARVANELSAFELNNRINLIKIQNQEAKDHVVQAKWVAVARERLA